MPDPKPSVEDSFRSGLADVLTVIERLSPLCLSIEELAGAVKSAQDNDCVLRLLLKEVQAKPSR